MQPFTIRIGKASSLKGSPTNVYKSFAPPVKGAGIKVEDAAQLVGILNDKHLI